MDKEQKVTNLAPGMQFVPALVLDLDGTIRRSKSGKTFIVNFEDIELVPGIEAAIWRYRNMGHLIVGISNQGGVAHGYKLPLEIDLELDTTFKLFDRNPFHIVKMCYHMEDGKIEPYCHRSLLRKPDIGMLAVAEVDAFQGGYIIDWDHSLFVGDRPEDEECAKNARIAFEHIDSFILSAHVAETESRKPPVSPVDGRPPENINELVEILLPRFAGFEENEMFIAGEDSFAAYCHSQLSGGIGMKIRNEFGLWQEDSQLHRYFVREYKLDHADDMSDLIIRGVYKKMKTAQANKGVTVEAEYMTVGHVIGSMIAPRTFDKAVPILLAAVNDVNEGEHTGVRDAGGKLYGTEQGKVFTWEEFLECRVKVGNIKM